MASANVERRWTRRADAAKRDWPKRPRRASRGAAAARAPRLDAGAGVRPVRAAVSGIDVPGAARAPAEFRSGGGADFHAHVDQDRRLPGRLRLLPAERALRDR